MTLFLICDVYGVFHKDILLLNKQWVESSSLSRDAIL